MDKKDNYFEEIKLDCLKIAKELNSSNDVDDIVEDAKKMYEFVTTIKTNE